MLNQVLFPKGFIHIASFTHIIIPILQRKLWLSKLKKVSQWICDLTLVLLYNKGYLCSFHCTTLLKNCYWKMAHWKRITKVAPWFFFSIWRTLIHLGAIQRRVVVQAEARLHWGNGRWANGDNEYKNTFYKLKKPGCERKKIGSWRRMKVKGRWCF